MVAALIAKVVGRVALRGATGAARYALVARTFTTLVATVLSGLAYSEIAAAEAVATRAAEISSQPVPSRPEWEKKAAGRIVVEFDGTFLDTSMLEVIKGFKVLAPAVFTRDYEVRPEDKRFCPVIHRELKIPQKACTKDIIEAVQTFSRQRGGGTVLRPGVVLKFPEFNAETFTIRKQYDASRDHERAALEKLRADRKESALPIRCEEIIRRDDVASPEKVQERAARQSASRSIAPVTRSIGGAPVQQAEKQPDKPKECAPLELRDGDDEAVYSITLEGLRWTILVRDPKFLAEAESAASKLSNTSRVVTVERALAYQKGSIKRYTFSAPDYYNRRCKINQALPTDRGEYALALRAEPDLALAPGIACENTGERSEVIILDTQIARHPDIQDVFWDDGAPPEALAGSPQPTDAAANSCGIPGSYKRDEHHGTYLAGIIASRGDKAGFVGIAPDVLLRSRVWNNQVAESDFRDYLSRQTQDGDALRVFLFASSFKIRRKEDMTADERKELLQGGLILGYYDQFKTPRKRFLDGVNGGLNKLIKERKMLLVVSAGQADGTGSGDPLQTLSLVSPQNLGDLENVIVVGACTSCNGPDMSMWGPSNFAKPGEQTVHVAAPGGTEIPGIISANAVDSTVGGTSAAAAYVAGIAARMQACYPTAYTGRASRVKEWLMLTARANLPAEDMAKVAGGVVDPELAMVNPRKSWLKQPEKPLREVDVVSWCGSEDVELTNAANVRIGRVQLRSMRRLTRVANNLLISKEVGEPSEDRPTAPITVLGPGRAPPSAANRLLAAVKMRQGKDWAPTCALQLKDVQDLVMRNKRDEAPVACEALPKCGG